MTEPKKPVRYMDFVGRRRSSATDPLIARPTARKITPSTRAVKPVAKPTAKPAVKPASKPTATVTKSVAKPAVKPASKLTPKPATAKPAAKPTPRPAPKPAEKSPEPKILYPTKTTDKPVDKTAKLASAALSGRSAKDTPDNNAYTLSGKSPFLPSYSVDKRPLSNSIPEKKKDDNFEKLSFLGVSDTSPEKGRKKNVYEKSSVAKTSEKKSDKKQKPVRVIDDTKKKSGLPLIVIILLTIIFGAAVGAGVYFILPK